jgi:PAS domain S-box-containing protein
MSYGARAYIGFIVAVGAACAYLGVIDGPPRDPPRFLCYLLLAIAASCLKVPLPGVTGTISILFLFLLAGSVELGLSETMLIGILCALVQSFWRARVRPRPVQVIFSIANIITAIAACYFVYHSTLLRGAAIGSPFRLAMASSVFFVTNTFPIAAVIALTERKSLAEVWRNCYSWSFPYYLVGAAIVGVFTFADRMLDWQAWGLILPVFYVIFRSYRLYIDRLAAERKRAEEQQRHADEVALLHDKAISALNSAIAANAKLDAVIQGSPMAILALDGEGHVTSWNTMAERMFGLNSRSPHNRTLPMIGSVQDEVTETFIRRTLAGEPFSGVELTQYREDGTSFQSAVWTAPLRDADDSVSGVLVTVADISHRKELEAQLQVAQRMEAVGRLAGGVAHDFNNLLTVINGYGAMLKDSLKDRPYEAGQARQILEAGERAADLVSKLLTFSRRQVVQPKPLRINDLVENIERMLRRLIGEHVELRTRLNEDAGWIIADPNQIEAVLMNLSSNARDAMPEGGILSIETQAVQLGPADAKSVTLPSGSYVRLTVTDTGAGIDVETLQHIFEPFFTTKQEGKGTGLGLSSVYAGVEQNGGHISVVSTVAKGTTFTIYLPRLEHGIRVTGDVAALGAVSCDCRGTVLLVEDEIGVRRMLREGLSGAGFRVWEAGNGAEALELWNDAIEQVDLLVTDIVMPVLSGLKLADELRRRKPNLDVLFMSGHSEEVISRQGVLHPGSSLLLKPFLPAALVTKVREILGDRRNAAPPNGPAHQAHIGGIRAEFGRGMI